MYILWGYLFNKFSLSFLEQKLNFICIMLLVYFKKLTKILKSFVWLILD